MDATDDGWGIVAQPLEAAAVPAARRGRGRPCKSTQPVEVPVAAGVGCGALCAEMWQHQQS